MLNRKLRVEEDFQLISDELTKIFSPNFLNDLARKDLFLQRSSKFEPKDFIALCGFLNHQSGKKSLTQLCGVLASERNISLSTEGLNQRFCAAGVNLLKDVFSSLISKQLLSDILPSLRHPKIGRIRILDSTSFELATVYQEKYFGYHKSGVRIQLEYELLKGELLHLVVQDQLDSDHVFAEEIMSTIQKFDLIIRDLGYFSYKTLRSISEAEAYYISRATTKILAYVKDGMENFVRLDIEKIMEEMEIGETREIENIYAGKGKLKIPRLILCKLTDEQTEKRLKKRKRKEIKNGVKFSHQTKKLSGLNMFITNIPYNVISKKKIQPLYSLRWQIEILFKAWKSIYDINKVKKMKVERFECHLYGTLISLLITSTLAFKIRELLYLKKEKEISEFKAFSIIKEFLATLYQALMEGGEALLANIEVMFEQVEKNGQKAKRLKKRTPFEILLGVFEKGNMKAA